MRFIWDQKYSVGVKSIDKQHQRFFEIINEVNVMLENDEVDLVGLKKVLDELIEYAEMHLNYEEEIFREIQFSDTTEHCQAHNVYRAKVVDYKLQLKDEKVNLKKIAKELADFAQDWLSSHIMAVDTKYTGEFLRADVK